MIDTTSRKQNHSELALFINSLYSVTNTLHK